MESTPVYIVDMGAAAAVGGIRINDGVILHVGLTIEQQGAVLNELLDVGERPLLIHPAEVRSA